MSIREPVRSSVPTHVDRVSISTASDASLEDNAERRLLILRGHGAGTSCPVEDGMTIGRDETCSLALASASVSRVHARLESAADGGFWIFDQNSTNGVFVNNERVRRKRLEVGDQIRLGQEMTLRFIVHDTAQDKLVHQQRMQAIGLLAGGIAHDFNNLLGSVVGNLSILRDLPETTPINDAEVVDLLDDVDIAVAQATSLIRQLLDFSRRDALARTPVYVKDLVEEVLRLCIRSLPRSIRIDVSIADDLRVIGDKSRLHQVVMNLVLNARDALPNGGTIRIRGSRCGGDAHGVVALSIADDGIGMDEATRRRVFEPFFTTKGMGSGTGLGMSTCYGIVQGHGGEIFVSSQKGKGTTFEVRLPEAAGTADIANTSDLLTLRIAV